MTQATTTLTRADPHYFAQMHVGAPLPSATGSPDGRSPALPSGWIGSPRDSPAKQCAFESEFPLRKVVDARPVVGHTVPNVRYIKSDSFELESGLRSPSVSRAECIKQLAKVFRTAGYERASLSGLASATGLQRSSLYHFFPGGKAQMLKEVIDESNVVFEETVLSALQGEGSPRERFLRLIASLDRYYDSGRETCLLGVLTAEMLSDDIRAHIQSGFSRWVSLLAMLLQEHGFTEAESVDRACESVAAIQGTLVLARGMGREEIFRNLLRRLEGSIFRESNECLEEKDFFA